MTGRVQRRPRVRALRFALALVMLLVLPVVDAASGASTVTVRPGATAGWSIVNRDGSTAAESSEPTARGTVAEFSDGPAPAPVGLGSLRQRLGAADDTTRLESAILGGVRLADAGTLGYATFVRDGRTGTTAAMQLLVDVNGDGRFRVAEDDVLTFEPVHQHGGAPGASVPNQCGGVSGCVATGRWQSWSASSGGWWSLRAGTYGPPLVTLASYQTLHPAARLASDLPSLRVTAGGGPSWDGYEGFIDAVVAGGSIYDLESFVRPVDCSVAGDDIGAVQTAIDGAPPGFAIRLRGSCDFSAAAAHGGSANGIEAAAVVLGSRSPARDIVIEPDGAPGSAAIVGSGTQTAFFVPPGAARVTIRGLRFANLARPIVIANASAVTIGAPGSSTPDPAGNSITGGVTMNSAVLAVASAADMTVRYGAAGGSAATYPSASRRLEDLIVAGNRIVYDAVGVPDALRALAGVDVRASGGDVARATIDRNAIWFATNEFRSFDMNGIRVQGSVASAATGVRVRDNSIGRPEEVAASAPATAAGGRIGILVHRAQDVAISGNRVRSKLSATPAADTPGGGIVTSDVADAVIDGNAVVVVADPGTEAADLGAVGVVDALSAAFGEPDAAPASTRVTLTNNVVGTPGQPGIGAQRGLVVAGSSWIEARGNTVVFSAAEALAIGPEIRGPAGTLPRAVQSSVFCDNDLDGAVDDPNETTVAGAGVAGSNFPGGSLLATNGECAPPGIVITETGADTRVAETGGTDTYAVALALRPSAPVEVAVAGGPNATASPATISFTPDDWAVPRTVTVTAVQDSISEGTHLQAITHTASSADAAYAGVMRTVLALIADDDPGSVLVAESGASTEVAEGGATDTYTVVLGSRPSADVRIVGAGGTQLSLAPGSLTFTPGDWHVPRTVTVAAADDTLREGPHLAAVTHRAISSDTNFNNRPVAGMVVRVTDNDAPAAPVITAPAAGSIVRATTVVVSGKGESGATVSLSEGALSLGRATVAGAGTWSIALTFAEGPHTVSAVQTDANGFTGPAATRSFVVDLTPPAAPVITAPSEGQTFLFAGIEVKGTAEPHSTVVVTEGSLARSATTDASGAWRVVIVFSEGSHTVVATIFDGAGNAGPSSAPRTFVVNADGIAPEAPVVLSPVQDGIVARRFTVTGTTEPNARVEIWEGSIPILGGKAGSDGFFRIDLELESRTWMLRARAIDTSFNVGPFASPRRVHVDGTAPTVSVRKSMPLPVVVLLPDEGVTAYGAASDNFGVARVLVTYTDFSGSSLVREAVVCCPDRGTVLWEDRATLAPGQYLVSAVSIDLAGNQSRRSSIEILRL